MRQETQNLKEPGRRALVYQQNWCHLLPLGAIDNPPNLFNTHVSTPRRCIRSGQSRIVCLPSAQVILFTVEHDSTCPCMGGHTLGSDEKVSEFPGLVSKCTLSVTPGLQETALGCWNGIWHIRAFSQRIISIAREVDGICFDVI